jgi:glycosyltransferase involved in cell wall biosynthesis
MTKIEKNFVSIVIPAFNEEESILRSVPRIISCLKDIKKWEVIVVDDGSTDMTLQNLLKLKKKYKQIRIITMQGNHGHMLALEAGLLASKGEYVFSIDADLQEPPEAIVEMLLKIQNNSDLDYVQAVRSSRENDSKLKRISAKMYYYLIRKLTGIDVIPQAADFRVIRRESLDKILKLPEKQKVFRLLLPKLGMRYETVQVVRTERQHDASKYNFQMMSKLALNSFFGFSARPLRMISFIAGFMALLFGFLAIMTFIIWINYKTVPGWTSIALLVLLTQTVVIFCISIIAEYISRIFTQILNRPSFQSKEI